MRLRLTLAFLLCGAVSLAAQTFRGTILGSVTDSSGAAVSGASVSARNTATGQQRTTQTSGDGSYSIPELPIGTYEVKASQAGFQTWVTRVDVSVASERRVDAQLKPGQVSERVEVSAESLPQVETTTNTLGGTMIAREVKDLPVNGRDYTKLIYLTPGIAGSPDQITDSPGSFGVFSMNGARGRSNNFLLDGTDMNDGYRNDPAINEAGVFGTPATILPIDAVAELRVLSNFEAEYGRNAGATVNIVTKSGTNTLHGTALEYFRNNALDARNYFNFKGQPQAPFHNNQYGGSLGGPIVKNKTFFFFNYEGQQERVGVVTLACVPDPAQVTADIAANGPANPVTKQMLKFWPAPNIPGTYGATSAPGFGEDLGCPKGPNASVISPSYNKLSSMIAKIDHNFNSNNILTGRYFFGDSTQSFPLALTATGGQLPGFNTVTPTRVQLVSISYVHTFGSNKVNEMRYGWNRFAEGFFPEDQSFHPSSIGLCAASLLADCSGPGPHNSGLPITLVSVTPSGASSFFAQPGTTSADPRQRVDTNNQAIDNFSWKVGKHDLKIGFEFRRTSIEQYLNKYFRGRMKFSNLSTFLAGTPKSGGFGSLQYSGNSRRHTYENNYGLYFQDGFRVTPRVTVNFGLRWDYNGVVAEKNNLFANFLVSSFDAATDTGTGTLLQVGSPGLKRLYEPDYKNFAPRVGIAWDVTGKGKTVVRAGFGIFYDAFSQDFFLGHLPYPAFYAPGPAYGNFGSPITAITAAALNPAVDVTVAPGNKITPGVPLYGPSDCGIVECDIFAVDRHIKTPYMENYNLNIQQQITNNVLWQIGYVGSQGHRLFRFFDINQPNPQAIFHADCPNTPLSQIGKPCTTDPGANIADFGAPRVFGSAGVGAFLIMQQNSTGKSNYNSLQTSLRLSSWHGITSNVNFVWSKSLDNSSDGEDFVPNAAQPQDSSNPQREYGPSNFNISKRFTWILSYELPKMGGSMRKLKNGWGVDSTVTLQTGQPFTLNFNGEDDFSGSGEGYDRPDVVGPIRYDYRHPGNFLDLTSFAMPCTVAAGAGNGAAGDCLPGTRHFGTLGRNALVGSPFRQWDLALHKDTALGERATLQLRVEFFNVLNHPNFSSPLLPAFIANLASNVSPFNNCGCGLHNAGNREVGNGAYQITATGDVGIGNPFLGGGGPRGIQLAAKITF
jgi:carboxypeptidase family protein/TonB-dependent receptor-like protein